MPNACPCTCPYTHLHAQAVREGQSSIDETGILDRLTATVCSRPFKSMCSKLNLKIDSSQIVPVDPETWGRTDRRSPWQAWASAACASYRPALIGSKLDCVIAVDWTGMNVVAKLEIEVGTHADIFPQLRWL